MKQLSTLRNFALITSLIALLAACGAGEITDGMSVALEAVPTTAFVGKSTNAVQPKHGDGAIKTFRRAEGERIDLEAGLVNLLPIGLQACGMTFANPFEGIISTAYAHEGHSETAPPGVLDVVTIADDASQGFGALAPLPGSYCGLRVRLLPIVSGDHSGQSIVVGPCYYAQSANLPDALAEYSPHECFSVGVPDGSDEFTVAFAQPLVLAAGAPNQRVQLKVAYTRWFDSLDMTQLQAADAATLQQLASNARNSFSAEVVQ